MLHFKQNHTKFYSIVWL